MLHRRILSKKNYFLIVLLILLLTAAGIAAVRTSANYRVVNDAVTSGGVPTFGSVISVQNSAGLIAGFSEGTNYKMNAGVVQPLVITTRVDDWALIKK